MWEDYTEKFKNLLFLAEMHYPNIEKLVNKGVYYKQSEAIRSYKKIATELPELYIQAYQWYRFKKTKSDHLVTPITEENIDEPFLYKHTLREYASPHLAFAVIHKEFKDSMEILLPEMENRGLSYYIVYGYIPFTYKKIPEPIAFRRGEALFIKINNTRSAKGVRDIIRNIKKNFDISNIKTTTYRNASVLIRRKYFKNDLSLGEDVVSKPYDIIC